MFLFIEHPQLGFEQIAVHKNLLLALFHAQCQLLSSVFERKNGIGLGREQVTQPPHLETKEIVADCLFLLDFGVPLNFVLQHAILQVRFRLLFFQLLLPHHLSIFPVLRIDQLIGELAYLVL